MDDDKIGLVLARASELRLKITKCIQQASTDATKKYESKCEHKDSEADPEADEDEDEETESLLNISDALEALEVQISSLQALQQQQLYEREAALAEIRNSQNKLFKKLNEYKGKDLEVIHEAAAFVGESVDDNNDLLLPPYPSRPSHPLGSDNGYLTHFTSTRKFLQNGVISNGSKDEFTKVINNTERNQMPSNSRRSPFKGVKNLLGEAAKAAFTVAGVICVLSLAGFEPRFRKRGHQLNVMGLVQQQIGEKGTRVECPPGKVPVMENGEMRCLVKERVEIPFESVIATPDVNYGCG